jgi:osmotically-inducible protein OsmY
MRRILLIFGLVAAVAVPGRALAQVSDSDLANSIAQKMRGYVYMTIFDDVNIAVNDRAVTLSGRVTMPFKRTDLGKSVAKIDGVRTVVNDIKVLPESTYDANLRVRIAQAIYGHPAFWQYASMACPPIHIIVEHGHVTLSGRVNSQVERMLAYALAQVDGVLSVTNDLKVDRQ